MHSVNRHQFTFHFSGDLSGVCHITNVRTGETLDVPFEALLDVVAAWVRHERIRALEGASTAEVLGLPRKEE